MLLVYLAIFMVTETTIYVYNKKPKLCAKHVLTVSEWFLMVFEEKKIEETLMARETPPLHGKCHFNFVYFIWTLP